MADDLIQLRVDGLTPLQVLELRSTIATTGSEYVTTLDHPSLGGGKVGEPTFITVLITLGPSVIAVVALWLAKQKQERTRNLKYTRIDPNGTMESFELSESSYDEGESPSAGIQAFLEKKLGHDAPTTG
jgi:hypothetical protein